jgi:hypothetical protein
VEVLHFHMVYSSRGVWRALRSLLETSMLWLRILIRKHGSIICRSLRSNVRNDWCVPLGRAGPLEFPTVHLGFGLQEKAKQRKQEALQKYEESLDWDAKRQAKLVRKFSRNARFVVSRCSGRLKFSS